MKNILKVLAILVIATNIAIAQEDPTANSQKWTSARPDGHAPISVMGDHTHHRGEWMFSYKFMNMNMEGLQQGQDNIKSSEVFNSYMVAPKKMTMPMHMLGVMYAPTEKLTLMAMTSVLDNEMDASTKMGMNFTTNSSGLGDLKISGLYQLLNKNRQQVHAQLGVSIPTGSIEEKDFTTMSNKMQVILPYPMQLGSGTLDGLIAINYLAQSDYLSFGTQLKSTLRFGENDRDYRFGNNFTLNSWLAYKVASWLSMSARVEGSLTDEISGNDSSLNPMMIPAANTKNSGAKSITTGVGINSYIPTGSFKNLRFGLEYAFPVYQNVNGIQLEKDETLTLGLQYSFH